MRTPAGWGRNPAAKPAIAVTTDSDGPGQPNSSKPANEVITDFGPTIAPAEPVGKISASASEAYRETIALELERGRNAMGIWQDLVDRYGFEGGYQSVQRFVRTLRGAATPEARGIIETRPGEECEIRDANHKREPDLAIRDSGYPQNQSRLAAKSGSDVESPSWAG